MPNFNIRIALTKIKGAKIMEIEGKSCKRTCVVIPIDNEVGTVQDSYEGKIDGMPTTKPLEDVQLNLTAFQFREPRYGNTHGIKCAFSKKKMERMKEEELRAMPFIGNLKPWSVPQPDDDDLPVGNEGNGDDW